MRGRKIEIVFVLCASVTAALAYLALLGDSGLWRRADLRARAARVEQSVQMLEQENRVLFSRLHGPAPVTRQRARSATEMWVLKFEGVPDSERDRDFVGPEASLTLTEARILFAVGFVLFLLVGLYFTATVRAQAADSDFVPDPFPDSEPDQGVTQSL